jgi:geranylgeranyl diphosphate synthase type II
LSYENLEVTEQQQQLSERINQQLASLDLPDRPSLLYDPVRYTLALAGKRVRPYLTFIGSGLCGGTEREAMPAALAIELLHNFTLLHDDIMDRANTRRGEPSVFKKWDQNTAILSGDVMYAKAFKQLQHYGESDQYSKSQYSRVMNIFLDSTETVCEGQAFDLEFETRNEVTLDEYIHMIEGKTAALISGALAIGGAVANATEDQITELKIVGREIGVAFQIQDDLLDAIADPEKFGKKQGGDIIEGKKTYLTLLALQRCNEHQRKQLLQTLTSENNSAQQIKHVIRLYKSLGVIDDSREAVEYHYQEAMEHLAGFTDSEPKNEIIAFLNRLISREY